MEVKAFARHIKTSPRKIRLVVDHIRGLNVTEAENRLAVSSKWASEPVDKLLKSAIANAVHNFKLDKSKLSVKTIYVDGGPTLKRFRPRAFGRAAAIRKRTSHIGIILTDEPIVSKKIKKNFKSKQAKTKKLAKQTV